MGYTRPQEFRPGTFLRTCDLCGIRYRNVDLVRGEDGFWRCKQYCVETPPITRDKISSASQQRREAPPPPHGIPFDTRDTYAQERQVFDFIVSGGFPGMTGGAGVSTQWQVNSSVTLANNGFAHGPTLPASVNWRYAGGYAEVSRYLYSVITEGKRPASWIAAAKTLLTSLANNVLASQAGPPGFPRGTSPFYGLVGVTANDDLKTAGQVGLALCMLYAYKANGDPRHLAGALASASYLRNVQAIGAFSVSNFTSSDAGGAVRLYTGGLISNANFSLANSHIFDSMMLPALDLWYGLLQITGDVQVGGTATLGGLFTQAPQQLLSQCIADLRAFVAVGAFDVFSGTTLTGWSATTPREKFNAYPTGTGSWEYADGNASAGTAISGSNIALALRTLYAYEGYSSQVSSIWTWLMGFGSNTAYQCAAGTLATDYACASTLLAANPLAPPVGQGNVIAPAYDPTLALTTLLTVKGTNTNGSSLYDWTTTGMLAPIQSSQNASAFRKAKLRMSTPVLRMPVTFADPAAGPVLDFPMLRGVSGLAMQLSTGDSGNAMYWNTIAAARCGGAFRYQPQAFTGANPPALSPGVTAG
jgi:hypothetical protein